MINTFCPRCNNPLSFEDAHAGLQGQCDKCNSVLTVPAAVSYAGNQQYYVYNQGGGMNGLGLAGFIVSLISILPLWILPLILAPLGIILSAVGLRHPKKGFAIAGLVIGGVVIVLWIVLIIFVVSYVKSRRPYP